MKSDIGCELCIAVAGFVEDSGSADENIGGEFGATLTRRLQNNLADLQDQSQMTIEVWGPAQVGKLSGKTIAELDEAAPELARKIGADIVVYGLIQTSGDSWEITPRFYISPDFLFQDALEVIGQDQLGAPFEVPGKPKSSRDKRMNDQASSNGRLLASLAVGMTHYSVYEYDAALKIFETAKADAQNWGDPAAVRLLYVLMGNCLLTQYERNHEQPDLLVQAEKFYLAALESDPGYARPYVGIGSIAYLKALTPAMETSNPADVEESLLSDSLEYYRKAAGLAPEPDLAHVREKTHTYIGRVLLAQAYRQYYLTEQLPDFTPVVDEFYQVIRAYEQAPDEILKDLVVDAHANLGLIAQLEGRTSDSILEYQTALDLTDDPVKRDLYKETLSDIQSTE